MKYKILTAVFSVVLFSTISAFAQGSGGTVTGKVSYQGPEVKPAPINFGAEKQCAMMHGDKMPVNEDIVINPNGTVKWTLVRIKEEVPGDYPAPADPVLVDQAGCVFIPHVLALRAGQPVEFKNSDDVLHNVRSLSKENKAFNVAQPMKGMKTKKAFDKPETGIPVKCDVHFWMVGYIHVLGNPFYAVTGEDGTFTIPNLPPGDYTLEVWHEKLGVQEKPVTVKEGETQTVDFVLEKK